MSVRFEKEVLVGANLLNGFQYAGVIKKVIIRKSDWTGRMEYCIDRLGEWDPDGLHNALPASRPRLIV
jgi:hypothetical protein